MSSYRLLAVYAVMQAYGDCDVQSRTHTFRINPSGFRYVTIAPDVLPSSAHASH